MCVFLKALALCWMLLPRTAQLTPGSCLCATRTEETVCSVNVNQNLGDLKIKLKNSWVPLCLLEGKHFIGQTRSIGEGKCLIFFWSVTAFLVKYSTLWLCCLSRNFKCCYNVNRAGQISAGAMGNYAWQSYWERELVLGALSLGFLQRRKLPEQSSGFRSM